MAREELTRIGGMPTQVELPRAGGVRQERTTTSGLDFSLDGLETRGEARSGQARDAHGTRFDQPPSARTGEHPRLPPRHTMEAPLLTDFQVPVPTSGGLEVHEGAEARPLEELLPTFTESIGEESLAHHFAEELRFLGAELRPSRLAPSERAERLWSFFLAYAEANAKDPAGQTEAGRELFREALTEHGFAGLREANTGRDGVAVALEMLEAQSPEELHEKLSGVRIEPGPEQFSSEVSLPVVEEHSSQPLLEAKAQPLEPGATRAVLDQTDQPLLPPVQAGGPQQGMVVPGMVPPHLRPVAEGLEPNPDEVPVSGHAQRGTNKRLGSHMVWNFLHRFRDPPELSAVEREKWSQVAFGAILALVGAALLLAMLVSL